MRMITMPGFTSEEAVYAYSSNRYAANGDIR
jgi:hypothetical protein